MNSPPPGLAEFEVFVRASDAPAVLVIDRELMRRLLDYMRQLEREVMREGTFW
jgi:hypothetical protein